MGEVTIDSIQIEIESSSTNAAKGIDALAGSLEKLKKHGSFKTVSTNLNNLSTALKNLPNVHSASNSLRTLANSIEKLKGVGSVSSLSNSLTKLPTALKSLSNINLDKVAPQVQRVADAVAPLSSIKAGGLNTMVNSMKKLGEVTDSLDDDTIERFAKKVELLNSKLAPLSEKMSSIKTGFNAINSSARKAADGVKDFGDGVNTGTLNMSNFIEVARTAIDTIQGFIQGFSDLISEAIEWDGISARFGRGFANSASETYAWIQRLNEEMGINIQEFMKYSSVYSTMLTGFGVAAEDAGKMALGYMELTYDIWAGYNDVYGSLEETAEAVKSAIAGEVEPVRRAGFTIVEATLEQTAANHGLEISLANATEAQKSYLRYLTLIDQAHAQNLVGTYAKELNTAEGLMRTFAQQLKSLTQAFGSLFLPILVKVMPWVQAFVELLTEGVYWLANLLGVDIQPVDFSGYESGAGAIEDVAGSAGDATGALNEATKAAKELKNATLGIDELNVISPSTATSGSGGSGGAGGAGSDGFAGLDIDSLWDETIFDTIQSDVEKINEKLKDWLPVIAGVATALAGLKLTNLLDDIDMAGVKLGGIGKAVSVAGITLVVGKLVWDFTGAYLEGGDEADLLKAFGSTALGTALAYFLAGKPGASFTLLASGVVTLTRLGIAIGDGAVEWDDPESLATMALGGIETIIGGIFTWKTLSPILKSAWTKLAPTATAALAKIGPYGWIAAAVIAGLTLTFVDYDFSDLGRTIGEAIGNALKTAGGFIANGLAMAWEAAVDLFTSGDILGVLMDGLSSVFGTASNWLGEKYNNLKGNINEFFGGLFDGVLEAFGLDTSVEDFDFFSIFETSLFGGGGVFGKSFSISKLLSEEISGIDIEGIGASIMGGIIKGVGSLDLFDNAKKVFTGFVDNVKDFFGINSPSTLMRDKVGKYIIPGITSGMSLNGIKDKLSSVWNTAKTWWDNKKPTLKSYTPNIGSIYDKIKPRWDNARTWWNNKKSAMKTYTPSIGSIYEKAYERWKNARDWWNNKKGSFKTYTPSIGSITDKLKSAWNSAKNWWNKNVKLSTKLNVQVPTIKVKWDTASAFGKSFKYPTGFSLKFAADGGIFDAGSLIWAGERGPEIVANASGGKTGVMNVQQMQDAVYEGVYAAMVSAMRGGNDGGSQQIIKVYLDGKEITSTVEKHQRERGAPIMGNEVYSY